MYSGLSYTPLVLDKHGNTASERIQFKSKKCKKSRRKKLKAYISEDKQELSVDDLLKTNENKIILVGKPGIGKTTAACQMLKLWGERDNKDLDYMFYFDMREMPCITNPMSLEDLLFVFSEPDEGKEEVLGDIKKNSENVTIIFDGVTGLTSASVMHRLVNEDLLPGAKIIITCRPEVEAEILNWASLRVEVKGFSTKSIRAYLGMLLNAEKLSNILNNVELFSLCHVPVYALMVVACFSFTNSMVPQQEKKFPCTVTEICINILSRCISLDNRLHSEQIFALAKAACQATEGKSLNLTELSSESSSVCSAFLNTLKVKVSPAVRKNYSAFLHYIIQEFFTALWFLKNPEKIADLLQQCYTEEKKHMKHVILFVCGLCNENNLDLLKCVVPDQQVKGISKTFIRDMVTTFLSTPLNQDQDDTDDNKILFLCQCLYESQSTEVDCLHFLDKLEHCLDLSEEHLDPHHYCAVSYVISQSKERKINLMLEDTVSEQGLRLILGCLENVQLDR